MGVVIKQSFWGTVIAYIGVIVGYLNALYFRAEYFDLDQIGLFTLITANAMMVSPISSFGMGSTYLKFFSAFDLKDRNRFFSILFLVTVLGNIVILFCGYLFKDLIAERYIETAPEYVDYLMVTAVIIVANSLFDLFFIYSNTIMKVIFPSFLRDIYLRAGSLLLVVGYGINLWSFEQAIVGLGFVYVLGFILIFSQLTYVHGFKFQLGGIITKEWRIKLAKFGAYSMLLAGSFALINNISIEQITAILGPDTTGIFTTCFFIAMVVEMPRRNMSKVIVPIISREFEAKNLKEVGNIYKRSSITMSVIGILLFIGIATNLQDLFEIIPQGEAFRAGFWVVLGVCFAKVAVMISSFSGEIINFSIHYKFNLLFQVISAIVLIVLNLYLIPIWGLNGAAISYLSAILVHILLKFSFVSMQFGLHPFMKSHIPLVAIGIVIGIGAHVFQPNLHPIINIGLRSILTLLIFMVLVYRIRISADINKVIHSTFERFLKINLPK